MNSYSFTPVCFMHLVVVFVVVESEGGRRNAGRIQVETHSSL